MIFVFYFFAAVLLWLSFKSFRGGFEYLRFFRTELAKPRSTFTPFATVIVPCRGLDAGMYENLGALFEQDYPEYEIVFAVDDAADSAASVIEEVSCKSANDAKRSRLIIAPKAVDCGQKVENLRESVLHVSAKSMVFVFVDFLRLVINNKVIFVTVHDKWKFWNIAVIKPVRLNGIFFRPREQLLKIFFKAIANHAET